VGRRPSAVRDHAISPGVAESEVPSDAGAAALVPEIGARSANATGIFASRWRGRLRAHHDSLLKSYGWHGALIQGHCHSLLRPVFASESAGSQVISPEEQTHTKRRWPENAPNSSRPRKSLQGAASVCHHGAAYRITRPLRLYELFTAGLKGQGRVSAWPFRRALCADSGDHGGELVALDKNP
jgi:hypothetical protein